MRVISLEQQHQDSPKGLISKSPMKLTANQEGKPKTCMIYIYKNCEDSAPATEISVFRYPVS